MSWLDYTDDEVRRFHPEFKALADQALTVAGFDHNLEWIHHVRTPGNTIIPDFVLRHKVSNQWMLAFELKRRRDAVYSTRNQIQAQGYAITNQTSYSPNAPKYFAISNLEVTILAALNGNRPPRECYLQNSVFESGDFKAGSTAAHKQRLVNDLIKIVQTVTSAGTPVFDLVWPAILSEFISYSDNLPVSTQLNIAEPNTPNWPVVREFFASPTPKDSARIFFLRCLMAEYLRGTLLRHSHPQANTIPPALADHASVANTIAALRQVDFNTLFEATAPDLYRTLRDPKLKDVIKEYLTSIIRPGRRVVDLARTRVDAPELVDSLMTSIYPPDVQDRRGKVQTDPELAAILARLAMPESVDAVLDPCCGDGVLLTAAHDLLKEYGSSNDSALKAVRGIEVDPIGTRLTEVRLALRQPSTLSPQIQIAITYGDLFANVQIIRESKVILMNPPFLRYEEQGGRRVPPELRTHYNAAILAQGAVDPTTTRGQANLYNYYVEFVIRSSAPGTLVGIILDNKWYHNINGVPLKALLLSHCEIKGIIEYPHSSFFANWTIATSILIIEKKAMIQAAHEVKFVRSKVDPRGVDLKELTSAFHGDGSWPTDWTCHQKLQSALDSKVGWKGHFSDSLQNDYRMNTWPTLDVLFNDSRRGSLEKEEGGVGVLEFPFNRTKYGPVRQPRPHRVGFQTERGRPLTDDENIQLRTLASQIPDDFRGWVLRNSYDPEHYELTASDVQKQQTLEPPTLRNIYNSFLDGRTPWTPLHDAALEEMRNQPQVTAFINEIERVVNFTDAVLPKELRWNVLREPIAGELIIPRKTRVGHWVHINPFAFDLTQRQVRISSNFLSYGRCVATDVPNGLTRALATRLITAFLVSSFGQLQFEMEGYNREGLLAVEKHHFMRIRIFDPRWIRHEKRQSIINAFDHLPYKIASNKYSWEQPERNALDNLFADEIVAEFNQFDKKLLLDEVHEALDEWLMARQP